jgi:hypothetical protein
MPTVFRVRGFAVRLLGPPREHPPPHVHVVKGKDALAIIRLRIGGRPMRVWAVYNMKPRDVLEAYRIVESRHEELSRAWEEMHGQASTNR